MTSAGRRAERIQQAVRSLEQARTLWALNGDNVTARLDRADELKAALAGHPRGPEVVVAALGSLRAILDEAVRDGDRALHHEILGLTDSLAHGAAGKRRNPPAGRSLDHWRPALAHVLRPAGKELESLVEKLLDDAGHALGVAKDLHRDDVQLATILLLRRLATGTMLHGRSLATFLRDVPGTGAVFAPVPDHLDRARGGARRLERFIAATCQFDPVRALRGALEPHQEALIPPYARRLAHLVEPAVADELSALAGGLPGVDVATRVKATPSILEKLGRRSSANAQRSSVRTFTVGHVLDAVGGRMVAVDAPTLARTLTTVRKHFGDGHDGRILSMENLYVTPRSYKPALRGVTLNCSTTVGGLDYPFELQLVTRSGILAADIDHNTVYKPYVLTTPAERRLVETMLEEAAATDQIESRRELRNDNL